MLEKKQRIQVVTNQVPQDSPQKGPQKQTFTKQDVDNILRSSKSVGLLQQTLSSKLNKNGLDQIGETRHLQTMSQQSSQTLFAQSPLKITDPNQAVNKMNNSQSVPNLPQFKQSAAEKQKLSSTILMNDRSKQKLELPKFDLKKVKSQFDNTHSYIIKQAPLLNSNSSRSLIKMPKSEIPKLVQYQKQLQQKNEKFSPFMTTEDRIITPSNNLPILSKYKKQAQSMHEQINELDEIRSSKQYLTLEVYDPWYGEENYSDLINKYKDPNTGETIAYSKWQNKEAEFKIRQCRVISYNKSDQLFTIQWLLNKRIKKVSRFNLRFVLEDQDTYNYRLKEAELYRAKGQEILKYLLYQSEVDLTQNRFKLPVLGDYTKTKISYLILSFNSYKQIKQLQFKNPLQERSAEQKYDIKFIDFWQNYKEKETNVIVNQISNDLNRLNLISLSNLFKELDQDYQLVHKKIKFDIELPYSGDQFEDMKELLPKEMYIPVQDRLIVQEYSITVKQRMFNFKKLLQSMSIQLQIAHPNKLKILQLSQSLLVTIPDQDYVQLTFIKPLRLDFMKDAHEQAGFAILKLFRNHKSDVDFEIQKIIAMEVSKNVKENQQILSELTYNKNEFVATPISHVFCEEIKQLQKVIQMRFEQSARQMFLNSTARLVNQLSLVIQLFNQDLSHIDASDILQISREIDLQTRIQRSNFIQFSARLKIIEGKIVIDPPIQAWTNVIIDYIEKFLTYMNEHPCFNVDETITEAVHEDKCTHIFDADPQTPKEQIEKVRNLLNTLLKLPFYFMKECQQFNELLGTDIKELKKQHKKANHDVKYYQELIDSRLKQCEIAEQLLFEPNLWLGPFQIDVQSVKQKLIKKTQEIVIVLFECIKKKIEQTNQQIERQVDEILQIVKFQKIYRDIEHVMETKRYLKSLPNKMLEIRALIQSAMSQMTLLTKYKCQMSEDEVEKTYYSLQRPLQIFQMQGECNDLLEYFNDKFFVELKQSQLYLMQEVNEIQQELDLLIKYEVLSMYEYAVNKCDQVYDRIEHAIQISIVVNRREILYNQSVTDYSKLQEIKKKFLPFNTLWCFARDYYYKYNFWINGVIAELDREKMPIEITTACKELLKLQKQDLRTIAGMSSAIANELRELFMQLRPYLPLVISLKNPDLQQRHWDIINKTHETIRIDPDLHQTINELVKINVMDILEDIASVSDIATKEKQLEIQLNKMRAEWLPIKFEFIQFEGTIIIQGLSPIWEMLDEQIQKTMIIAGSPYVKYLVQDVLYWKQQLIKMQEVLEEWSKVQRGWLYLFPIFNSTDIQRQLIDVAQTFNSVDKLWRVIMLQTQNQPQVVEACNQPNLFENLYQCNQTTDKVQKSLNKYLNEKRILFPRFFFLSNDDLLHILSQTKEPQRVQDHLNKCFEGIQKLKFIDDTEAIGMFSQIQEYVKFPDSVRPISIDAGVLKIRPVEDWLLEVEQKMRSSLKIELTNALEAFSQMEKQQWIEKFAQQIILVIDQLQWTTSMEFALQKYKTQQEALKEVYFLEQEKIKNLVKIIQMHQKEANPVILMTLNNLIVLDVHTKDVTHTLLSKGKQLNINDFDWQLQMRHYQKQEDVTISMMDSTREYGYEYLGNQTRLVITPLTDRCFRTLMGALKLNLGGAPEGPAGTGKTETTKDLSKAIAKQCLVFNCSDQLDYQTMGKFFKGLACCGAWACFDEFNRIELEVLSVIAAQILTIQISLMRKKPNSMFNFEDEMILMNAGCAVFITMNPGYAGRSELPDNLKALFRPVAMMVPDYAMIAEISLYSYGFKNSRELSIKITQSLKLSSEQLSTQSHYDYGMRAVKSIILAAGVYKAESPQQDEHKLVLKAICDCNQPKFTLQDQPIFLGIINDLFPFTESIQIQDSILQQALIQVINEKNLSQNEEFLLKAVQLFDTIRVRHGLMLVGAAMAGKSEVTNTLAQAMGKFEKKVDQYRINPKSVSIGKLYGDFEKLTRDWQDGIIAKAVKQASLVEHRSWIVLDGPVDAVWIENLNTVLDDNKKLCLVSGEIIKLTSQMTIMFEVEDLNEASPATVSRCGMVYLIPEQLGWKFLIKPWLNNLPPNLKQDSIENYYQDLIDHYLQKIIDFLFGADKSIEEDIRTSYLRPVVQNSKIYQVKSFLNIFQSLLMNYQVETNDKAIEQQNIKQAALEKLVDDESPKNQKRFTVSKQPYYDIIPPKMLNQIWQIFIMALIWGFGANLPLQARSQLSTQIHQLSESLRTSQQIFKKRLDWNQLPPVQQNIFNLNYCKQDKIGFVWMKWESFLDDYDLLGNLKTFKQIRQNSDLPVEDWDNSKLDEIIDEETDLQFNNIFVVTSENLKQKFYLQTCIQHNLGVLILGDTGSGKTKIIQKYLQQLPQKWETGQTVLSATTSAAQIQKYLESCIEKHKKGLFGPKNPQNNLLIFIDDLNIPMKEKYGAQPPLEIVRQWVDQKGCYNQNNEWYSITSQIFVSSMQPVGGGRSMPSNRLLRHFNLFYQPEFERSTLKKIFITILEWGFAQHPDEWKRQIQNIAHDSIEIFERTNKNLLPLPSKNHYRFNLRQVSEIIQSLLQVPVDFIQREQDKFGLLQKLWVHESLRVFSDRFINCDDQKLFIEKCLSPCKFKAKNAEELIFCNFVDPTSGVYQEINNMQQTKNQLEQIIVQYNEAKLENKKINIFIFDYVIQHLARISRILKKTQLGNGILVGLGDNGRKTITKIAAYINDYLIYTIEPYKQFGVAEWQEELRSLHKTLGIENKKQIFLLTDADIRQENQIEDINNILNAGDIIGLFKDEDIEEIHYELEKKMRAERIYGKPMDIFMQRCKSNLHIMLVLSPAGNQLQQLFRKYQSLVNCASIDWFLNWPSEALSAVATSYLQQYESLLQQNIVPDIQQSFVVSKPFILEPVQEDEDHSEISKNETPQLEYEQSESESDQESIETQKLSILERVCKTFVQIHQTITRQAEIYFQEKQRCIYVTPSSFIRLFEKFIFILKKKSDDIENELQKFQQGIQNLDLAKIIIDEMQEKLEALKPVLEIKSRQVDQIMQKLSIESKEVMKMKNQVDNEANIVEIQRKEAEGIKNQCQLRLAEAQPHFERAIKALKTLTTNDFVILKSFQNPPDGVKLALEACCIMLNIQPDYIKGPDNAKVQSYWEKSKKLIKDYKALIVRLENFDKDNISETTIKKIKSYIENAQFNPDLIRNASNAAEGICKWVIALYKYDIVQKEIQPKREALAESEKLLAIVKEQLRIKQEELAKIIAKNDILQSELQAQLSEKTALINQRDSSQKKLNRASILMLSIGNEKDRWITTSLKLQKDKVTLVADTILSIAFVIYLGMFDVSYRQKIYQEKWGRIFDNLQLHRSEQPSIKTFLSNEEQIAGWLLKGLPGDSVSIENMIILQQCKQNPVFVDPQYQAFTFFQKILSEKFDQELIIIKLNQLKAIQIIEQAIDIGKSIMILNCGDVKHPALLSICKLEIMQINGSNYLKFNDEKVPIDTNFKPYIFTQFDNPNLSPEIQQAAIVLNFCVTSEGLEEQLLNSICKHEQAKEEIEREKLAKQNLEFNKQRKMYMEQILQILRTQGSEILESDSFVDTMEESRKITNDINNKLSAAKHIEDRLEENRKILKPLAVLATKLFFVSQSLSCLDPMYRYSMAWFISLFNSIFAKTEEKKNEEDVKQTNKKSNRRTSLISGAGSDAKLAKEIKATRVNQLKKKFRELFYIRVQMSLFEQHKLLLSFYIAIKLNEPSQISDSDFSAKLKVLDKLLSHQSKKSQGNSINKLSQPQSTLNPKQRQTTAPILSSKQGGNSSRVSVSHAGSDSSGNQNKLQSQANELMAQKEEERIKIEPELLKFVLTGLIKKEMQPYSDLENPNPTVFSSEMWKQLQILTSFDHFESIQEDIISGLYNWERFMRLQNLELLPEPQQSQLHHFAFIPLMRILKPELTTLSIRRYVKKSLGECFISPHITYFRDVYEQSSYDTPLLVILTPGNDPMEAIKKVAEEKQKITYPVSLGKGQSEKAKYHINEMRKAGGWIVLQNCHLSYEFLQELEQIVESITNSESEEQENKKGYEKSHLDFRMWLTSASIDYFPLTVLQKSIKVTSEPPKGIKTSLIRTYTQIINNRQNLEYYESCKKQEIWQPLFFALSFFHAVVRERRRYAQLGWNLPTYDFNESDFRISQRQLYNMVSEYNEVPYEALRYLCGECNYGGRVTDDRDRRTLTSLIKDYYNPQIFEGQKHIVVEKEEQYAIVKLERAQEYLEFCNQLPSAELESPYLVGLHENAKIIQSKSEAQSIFQQVLNLSKNQESKINKNNQNLKQLVSEISGYMREPYILKEVEKKYPFSYEESMNGVLLQELSRYNSIINIIQSSLYTLQQALEGFSQTTQEVENLSFSISNNFVPDFWLQKSYPTRKALLPYIQDLALRFKMFQDWIDKGVPEVFWISGFYFTHCFLAGIKQNFARSHKHPYDRVDFQFKVTPNETKQGSLINGLYLEGAGWDEAGGLCESTLKVIHYKMPNINLIPVLDKPQIGEYIYECPTYVTSFRAGTLSTTGHSTNFIMTVDLPSFVPKLIQESSEETQRDKEYISPQHWIKRSVAFLSQLDI